MLENYNLRKNHKFLSSAGLIQRISEPLRYFDIHLFTYLKKFNDGSQIYLSTNANWVFDYYHLALYKSSFYSSEPHPTGASLWPSHSSLPVFQHGRDKYDSVYGLTLCQNQVNSSEYFFFSLSSKNYKKLNLCINNLDLLESFTNYFKDKTSSLITQDDRIIIPNSTHQPKIDSDHYLREKFSKAIKCNSLSKWLNQFESLTKREEECLYLLIDNPTIPELANQLNISKRTAETHLERIKSKLQCRSKQELLIKIALLSV